MNGKCGNCGLVNPVTEENCKRCSHKINKNWKPEDLSKIPSEKAKGFSIAPFVLVAVIAGGGFALWKYMPASEAKPAPAVAAKAPAANAPAGEKPILDAAIAPANGQQQGGGVAAKFENSKAITDANNHAAELNKMMDSGSIDQGKK